MGLCGNKSSEDSSRLLADWGRTHTAHQGSLHGCLCISQLQPIIPAHSINSSHPLPTAGITAQPLLVYLETLVQKNDRLCSPAGIVYYADKT